MDDLVANIVKYLNSKDLENKLWYSNYKYKM
jgi:hypothetical protein